MNVLVPTLDEFVGLPTADLDTADFAVLNLFAARGLPGTSNLDIDLLLSKLDDWADQVKREIWRHLYRFDVRSSQPPTEFNYGNSLGKFFCWYLLQVLQEDCGVRYHPDRKFKPDFCQPEDLFIHGIVADDGKGGTCASMPVVYVAVARRLGLPVYLVEARGHLLFRWEDHRGTLIEWNHPDVRLWIPPDRFNVEGSGEGIAYYSDSHYVQWPELWTETDFVHDRYLRSMTARENLAAFLIQRAECFYDLGVMEEALKAIFYARQLEPTDLRYEWLHAKRSKEYHDRSHRLPDPEVHRPARRPLPGAHPPHCQCYDCQQSRTPAQRFLPSHGESCQCWNCRTERESKTKRAPATGHPPGCLCPMCQPLDLNPHHHLLEGF